MWDLVHEAFHRPTSPLNQRLTAVVWVLIVVSMLPLVFDIFVSTDHPAWLLRFDEVVLAAFAVEYVLRVASYHPPAVGFYKLGPAQLVRAHIFGRLRFMLQPMMLVDLLTILGSVPLLRGLRALRLLRLLRSAQILRYANPFEGIARALEENALLFAFGLTVFFGATVVGGLSFYLTERDANEAIATIPDAMWWSIVTLTTVGYGDRIPQTIGGRIVAMVWMFSGIILISSFTATTSSVLTVSQLESEIDGPEDLAGVRVGTVAASTSATWCEDQRLYAELYESPQQALEALADGEVEAVVYDAPVLQYLTHGRHSRRAHDLSVLPHVFARQNYAVGLRQGLPGREELNQNLLRRVESPWYRELNARYLGQ